MLFILQVSILSEQIINIHNMAVHYSGTQDFGLNAYLYIVKDTSNYSNTNSKILQRWKRKLFKMKSKDRRLVLATNSSTKEKVWGSPSLYVYPMRGQVTTDSYGWGRAKRKHTFSNEHLSYDNKRVYRVDDSVWLLRASHIMCQMAISRVEDKIF